MANIDKLQRQQAVKWPEFSWETEKGNADSKRCFQQFATDISRLGYTDTGRVYSIICPQRGFCSPAVGTLNVEVTVTGQRGWVDETNQQIAADMSVVGKIWFSPSAHQNQLVKTLWTFFRDSCLPFPSDKANAIRVTTHKPHQPEQPIFPLRSGESSDFDVPDFARHDGEAWSVGHVAVEIGPIEKVGHPVVDGFNELIMDIFNLASGNLLQVGTILTWNVWFTAPELVNTEEWRTHAEKWRDSIDADHGSPDGPGEPARYFDGTLFEPLKDIKTRESDKIIEFLEKSLSFGGKLAEHLKGLEKIEFDTLRDVLGKPIHV